MRTETIIFDGKAYHRYPDSKSQTLRDYYRHHPAKSVVLFLHREVWKRCHGRAIPKGYHVHHKDEDTGNNAIENLELLSYSDHMRRHHAGKCSPAKAAHLARVRPKGWAWHKTPEGRAYHRKRARAWTAARPVVEVKCPICKTIRKVRQMTHPTTPYCSKVCRVKSGVDKTERSCELCGKAFTANRWKPTRFCSMMCARHGRKG